jgi:multidrug efflux pump subunit AcrB
MIAKLVSFALQQRFLIVIASLALMVWGALSFQKLPIDAYPDLSPPHVEIITQWPGHAAEEVERLVSIPIEIEMNGIPRLEALRSISLYGLSAIEMNFEYGADPYFVREQAFERMANANVPSGGAAHLSPLFSPSGLIYRYVMQSPDRSPQDLKVIEDWVLERHYRSIQGVADDSGFGGTTMQYQVLLDPNKLFAYGVTVPQVTQQLGNNNANAGGGFYSQGGQFYYIRGLGLVRDTADIGNIVLQEKNGIPVYVKDIAKVEIGHAPRLGQFGYMKQDEAVEGVILMRVGEQAQVILRRVEAMTKELNEHVLPPDVKVVPYYDRQGLIEETTKPWRKPAARHAAGAGDPGTVPVQRAHGADRRGDHSVCADVLVHLPGLAAYSREPAVHRRHRFRHHRGRLGGDGGEYLPRTGRPHAEAKDRHDTLHRRDPGGGARRGAADLLRDRGDHRRLPADLRAHRAFGPAVPAHGRHHVVRAVGRAALRPDAAARAVLLLLRKHVHEPRARVYEAIRGLYGRMLGWCLRNRLVTVAVVLAIFARRCC